MREIEWMGTSGGMASLREDMELCSGCDARVLITADSGIDRALIARTIHERSVRGGARFVRVNCADVPEECLETKLFGQIGGPESESAGSRAGAFEAAQGGTVFLDDVGDLSPRLQARLLEYLESGEIRRARAFGRRPVNARVIVATGSGLADRLRTGWFSEDLFYRLNLIHIVVPPLADRREDVPLLIEYLLHQLAETASRRPPTISPRAMALLRGYSWPPGNVRELRLVLEKLAAGTDGEVAEVDDLPARIRLWQPGPAVMPTPAQHRRR